MKSILMIIPQTILVMLLSLAATAMASTDQDSEAARISEALELYVQAVPMDASSTERTKLLKRSETILLDVIEKNPWSLDAHRKLMGVYLQMRDYSKAIRTMQGAITLSPEDPKLFIALAILYDHQGAYEYALPVLEQALSLDPTQQLALDYRADIQRKIEMQRMAMEATTAPHQGVSPHAR